MLSVAFIIAHYVTNTFPLILRDFLCSIFHLSLLIFTIPSIHSVLLIIVFTLGKEPNEIDIVFLMGASNPGGQRHISNEKRLVEEILQRNNTPNSRFAIVQYENTATVRSSLNEYTNTETFIDSLNLLYWRGDATDLPSGLEKVKMLFEKEGRPRARKIIVIFSDGKLPSSVENIVASKKPLEDKGIKIISVTVGDNVDEDKLNALASKNETIRHDDERKPKDTADKIKEDIVKGASFIPFLKRCTYILRLCIIL